MIMGPNSFDEKTLCNWVKFFITTGGNINLHNNEGKTPWDLYYAWKSHMNNLGTLLKNKRVKATPGINVSDIQRIRSREFVQPGYESDSLPAPVRRFSYENSPLLIRFADFLPSQQVPGDSSSVNVCDFLENKGKGIGKLLDDGEFISTLFLIKDDWVMTARHAVNFVELANLTACFGESVPGGTTIIIPIVGFIETGYSKRLDYIILKLESPIDVAPLSLANTNDSTSLLVAGYNSEGDFCFSAFSNPNPRQREERALIGYQQTDTRLSGSPYFDLDGNVCGLHLRASTTNKTGLWIKQILDTNRESILQQLQSPNDDVSRAVIHESDCFKEFTEGLDELGDFDEAKPLKITYTMYANGPLFKQSGRLGNQSSISVQKKL